MEKEILDAADPEDGPVSTETGTIEVSDSDVEEIV